MSSQIKDQKDCYVTTTLLIKAQNHFIQIYKVKRDGKFLLVEC